MTLPAIYDSETEPFGPANKFPRLVCGQTRRVGLRDAIHLHPEVSAIARELLTGGVTAGHNIAYDMGVLIAHDPDIMPLIFAAYREDRIQDTQIRDQLIEIAAGRHQRNNPTRGGRGYSLAACAKARLGRDVAKGEDTWRLRYGQLRGVPLHLWPAEAVSYALGDVMNTGDLWFWQEQNTPPEVFADQFRQVRAAFMLALTSAWGFITDPYKIDALETFINAELKEHASLLKWAGLLRPAKDKEARLFDAMGRPDDYHPTSGWKRSAKLAGQKALALEGWPLTDTGRPSLDETTCEIALQRCDPRLAACEAGYCDHAVIDSYGKYSALASVLSSQIPLLRRGIIHCGYGLADTGRATAYDPNTQNFKTIAYGPKNGPKYGIRECITPRPGWIFISADFGGMECCTFAQACIDLFGFSRMGELINQGLDCHLEVARTILGIPYDEAKKRKKDLDVHNARQTGKVLNFGLPGGLGAEALCEYAWALYKVRLTVPEAKQLKATWLATYPEGRRFFAYMGRLTERGPATVVQARSHRIRGGLRFTQACNTHFQGPGGDLAKAAGWAIAERCYLPEWRSPLYGCRMIMFNHDEYLLEAPRSIASDAGEELGRVMRDTAKLWLPDVTLEAPPQIHMIWTKAADTVRDKEGRLIEWIPTHDSH